MIVYYDPKDLSVGHVVQVHSAEYDPACNGAYFVKNVPDMALERIRLYRNASGQVVAMAKKDFAITLSAAKIKLGLDAVFVGVPQDTSIAVNQSVLGTMDASGVLDFTPKSAGRYSVVFDNPLYVRKEFSLEVVQ